MTNPKARRVEIRFPDASGNPYLTFTAMMMAGLDGIQNKIHPGDPMEKDLYDLPPEEEKNIATVAHSLDLALDALDAARDELILVLSGTIHVVAPRDNGWNPERGAIGVHQHLRRCFGG